MTEIEKELDCFSTQCNNELSASKPGKELKIVDGVSSLTINSQLESVGVSHEALSCDHVYCEACIIGTDNVKPTCKDCGSVHPSENVNVRLALAHFLEKQFVEIYGDREMAIVKQLGGTENGSKAC